MFDEYREEPQYEQELAREFKRVMLNNVIARRAYDAATKCGMDEDIRLRCMVVALADHRAQQAQKAIVLHAILPPPPFLIKET